jgi:phosphotransferase system HPr-like phosphotransfer protein
MKIRLATPELVGEFINICSMYKCDINVYYKNSVLDGKSIMAIFDIPQGEIIEVQAISSNENVVVNFINNMKKFEV